MELDEARKRIEDIDRRIVELLAERLRLAEEIAKTKLVKGLNIVDDAREVELRLMWRKLAAAYGVPLELIERVFDCVLSYSKEVQFRILDSRMCKPENSIGSVAILGYGRMAQALGKLLVRGGYSVVVTGRDVDRAKSLANTIGCGFGTVEEVLRGCRYVLLALSPKAFEEGFVDGIAKDLSGKVVMDILSAKGRIFRYLEELSKLRQFHYVSTHPLFGPSTPAQGQKIVLIPSETGTTVLNDVVKLWKCCGLDVVIASFEEHEKAMAIVQVLTHLVLLAFEHSANVLSEKLGVNHVRFSTPTFKEVMAIVTRLNEIRDVVIEIQKNNLFSPFVHKVLLDTLSNLVSSLGGDK